MLQTSHSPSPAARRFVWPLIVLLLLVDLALVLLGGLSTYSSRQQYRERAVAATQNLAYLLEHDITDSLSKTDLALLSIRDELQRVPVPWRAGDGAMNEYIARQLSRVPFAEAIRVADAQGDVLFGIDPNLRPNVADREYFAALREDTSNRLFISRPMVGRINGRWSIMAARRIDDGSGAFAGVVLAVIPLERFLAIFRSLDIGKAGAIALRDAKDFALVVRWPETETLGRSIGQRNMSSEFLVVHRAGREIGIYDAPSALDHTMRTWAFRRFAADPFYIFVGLSQDEYLAGWRRSTWWLWTFILVFVTLSVVGARLALRWWERQNAATEALDEAQLRYQRAVHESHDRLLHYFSRMPIGCIVWEAGLKVERWNAAAERLFRIGEHEAPGLRLEDLPLPGDLREMLASAWERVRQGLPVPQSTREFESGGRHLVCEWTNTALLDADGSVRGMLSMVRDVTDREQMLQQQFKVEKLESLGVLAGGLAHDFNNLLTGILGNISLARLSAGGATAPVLEPLAEAERASARAADLAHQLLTFAKGGRPVKAIVSVRALLDEALGLVLSGSNVRADVEVPPDLPAIEADAGQLTQVFNNLFINAMQAMPGGGTLRVTLDTVELDAANPESLAPGPYVRVRVSDTGHGIAPQDLGRIFDPYFTTKPKGTGLGLASVYSIIGRHAGSIRVESTVGAGTTFDILLPAVSGVPADERPPGHEALTAPGPGGTVLVLDDEAMIRRLMAQMLKSLGYEAVTCESGEDAVAKYREAMETGRRFTAAIMDLTIPGGMGGKEAASAILALDPAAFLVVSSGYSNDPVVANCGDYGFQAAIAKPYRVGDLARVLKQIGAGAV